MTVCTLLGGMRRCPYDVLVRQGSLFYRRTRYLGRARGSLGGRRIPRIEDTSDTVFQPDASVPRVGVMPPGGHALWVEAERGPKKGVGSGSVA